MEGNSVKQDDVSAVTGQSQMAVLFVDDEPNILAALKRIFRPSGYRVHVAESGAKGLELLANESIDVVVSDMRMPEMDGAEFLGKVAAQWPRTERILLTGFSDLQSTVKAVNTGQIYRYISKPWDEHDLKLTIHQAIEKKRIADERDYFMRVVQRQNEQLKKFNSSLEGMVTSRTEEAKQSAEMLELAYHELKHSYVHMIPVFANLIELREGRSAGHSRRVAELARVLAVKLELLDEEVDDVYFAALLHDIGKIGLSDELLDSSFVELSQKNRRAVEQHSVIAQAALMAVDSLEGAALMIRSHHERFDGKGYPDELEGEAILMGARILAVANDYDTLQMGMLVDQVMSQEDAAAFIEANSGTRYDPQVVKKFMEWFATDRNLGNAISELILTQKDLREGMKLTRDLINKQGILLLAKGRELDQRLIEKIRTFEQDEDKGFSIYVANPTK